MHSENIESDVNDKLIVKSKPKDNYYNFCEFCSNCLFIFCLL